MIGLSLKPADVCAQVEIYGFFKAIYEMWVACGQYAELSIEDVKDEIFDLVQPADPLHITLQDLLVHEPLFILNFGPEC